MKCRISQNALYFSCSCVHVCICIWGYRWEMWLEKIAMNRDRTCLVLRAQYSPQQRGFQLLISILASVLNYAPNIRRTFPVQTVSTLMLSYTL